MEMIAIGKELSLIMATIGLSAFPAQAENWGFQINPYLQATTIEGDAGIGVINAENVTVDFNKILETLDAGAMVNFKGVHRSGWGFIVDYAFMDLKDDIATPRDGIASSRVRQGVLQVEGLYTQKINQGNFDYLFGLRWWDNDFDLDVTLPQVEQDIAIRKDEDWVDYFIGARWTAPINRSWSYSLRGDLGMGGADFTSSFEGGVLYHFNKKHALDIKYKATFVDVEDGEQGRVGYFKYDTVTHGPVIGYMYQF